MNALSSPNVFFLAEMFGVTCAGLIGSVILVFALRPTTTAAEITGIVGLALAIAGIVVLALGEALWPGLDLANLWLWLAGVGIALGLLSVGMAPKTARPNFVNTVFDDYSSNTPKE